MRAFWELFVIIVVLSSAALAEASDAGLPLMLRKGPSGRDRGLDVQLPPSIPVDSPFYPTSWVPADVSAVHVRRRSGTGTAKIATTTTWLRSRCSRSKRGSPRAMTAHKTSSNSPSPCPG